MNNILETKVYQPNKNGVVVDYNLYLQIERCMNMYNTQSEILKHTNKLLKLMRVK